MITNFIIWILVGGLAGWASTRFMETDKRQGDMFYMIVGVVGAALAALIISPLIGISSVTQSHFSFGAMILAIVGAAGLLLGVNRYLRRAH